MDGGRLAHPGGKHRRPVGGDSRMSARSTAQCSRALGGPRRMTKRATVNSQAVVLLTLTMLLSTVAMAQDLGLGNTTDRVTATTPSSNYTATDDATSDAPAINQTTAGIAAITTQATAYTTDCFIGNGATYIGNVSVTDFGIVCQDWSNSDAQTDNPMFLFPGDAPNNFCRNPRTDFGYRSRPWCYTKTALLTWQYCAIAPCGGDIGDLVPEGVCERLDKNHKHCVNAYGDDAWVYVNAGGNQRGAYSLVAYLYQLSFNAFFRQACLQMSESVMCSIYLPRCDHPHRVPPTPERLCREDCETIKRSCYAEWAFSISISMISSFDVRLPTCASFPSYRRVLPGFFQCHFDDLVLNETVSCYRDSSYADYDGVENTTVTGKQCVDWLDVPAFQPGPPNPMRYRYQLAGRGNRCRDLLNRERPWCVTSFENATSDLNHSGYEWDYCNVSRCVDTPTLSTTTPPSTGANGTADTFVRVPEDNTSLALGIGIPLVVIAAAALVLLAYFLHLKHSKRKVYPYQGMDDDETVDDARSLAKQHHWAISQSRTRLARTSISAGSAHALLSPNLATLSRSGSLSELARRSTLQLGALPALLGNSRNLEDVARENEFNEKVADLSVKLEGCLVNPEALHITESIGEGEFSRVFTGEFRQDDNDEPRVVAVKCAKDSYQQQHIIALLEEAVRMRDLNHPNVMGVKGVRLSLDTSTESANLPSFATAEDTRGSRSNLIENLASHVSSSVLRDLQKSPLLLLPFIELGDLKSLLKAARLDSRSQIPEWLNNYRLVRMSYEIAAGLAYLSSQNCVHRDIAARNCLVRRDYSVIISDFGLSRAMDNSEYYRQEHTTRMPVKWMAPECLHDRLFTRHSDVWAFGVTVWEVFSLGQSPYPGLSNFAVPGFIKSGRRLDQPTLCPAEIYDVLKACWSVRAEERPSIDALHSLLSEIIKDFASDTEAGQRLGVAIPASPGDEYVDMMALSDEEEGGA